MRPTCVILALLLPSMAAADALDERAAAFVAALSKDDRADATWAFDDDERADVHYAPLLLDGVRHGDLPAGPAGLAEQILAVTLSARGHEQVRAIRDLERDVLHAERGSFIGFVLGRIRDPGRYLWAVFGEPSADGPWGYRYEGHHLSLNVTAVPGSAPATTPLFLGAQPRSVPLQGDWPSAGVLALGEEEGLARALYAALTAEQRQTATVAYAGDRGLMIGQVARVEPGAAPMGLARAQMSAEQQVLLDALLERFAGFWNDEIASARRDEIADARVGLHFAHVESDDPPNAFYTRVGGPGLLIELDNTEGGDHVHAVWHRPGADFADDLLERHYARAHWSDQ